MGWLLCMPNSSSRARRRLIKPGSSLVLRCAIDTPAQFQMALCWKRCCTAAGSVCKMAVAPCHTVGSAATVLQCSCPLYFSVFYVRREGPVALLVSYLVCMTSMGLISVLLFAFWWLALQLAMLCWLIKARA